MSKETLNRGDFIILNFHPQAGHEQAGTRIAIVLSPRAFNEATNFTAVCPITNQLKGYPYEVALPKEGIFVKDGNPITGSILADQVKTLDLSARYYKILKKYNPQDEQIEIINEIIEECLAKIETYLGF
ncbi:type II toxin-antitoxin system PemK/MazF family toxin [Ureibacillus thermosphaericus]|uniref:type II toxin-antitoxin system PemK/MazF family toxin n=1 Tax=Ureibacillus thermosphaericus TaxID=51173 RepID=UPI000BBBF617|nr:type II toxin-antitoxin system PemK/MazF family toxin [Ureibacillus thermosphaericus]